MCTPRRHLLLRHHQQRVFLPTTTIAIVHQPTAKPEPEALYMHEACSGLYAEASQKFQKQHHMQPHTGMTDHLRSAVPRFSGLWRVLAALAGALLTLDAVWLMSMRLFHFGIVLPLLIGLALLALGWQWNRWHAWLAQRSWRRQAWRAWLLCFAAWLVSLGVFVGALLHSSRTQPADQAPAAIVVLGSGTPRCQVSPTLAERLKVARQWAQRLPQAPVVVSGGKDLWLDCTESAVMQAWLVQHGVDATRIVQEPRSTSTAENLQFSQALLAARGMDAAQPVLIVTSDFHQLRARWIARRAGFTQVRSAGGPTPLYLRGNAYLREYFAFISGWLLGEY